MLGDLRSRAKADNAMAEHWLLNGDTQNLLADDVTRPLFDAWLGLISEVEADLDTNSPHLSVLLDLRREFRDRRGRNGWVAPTQAQFPYLLSAKIGKTPDECYRASRNTFHAWWRHLLDLVVREAIRRGLL